MSTPPAELSATNDDRRLSFDDLAFAATKIQALFRGKKERESFCGESAITVGLRMRPFVPADRILTATRQNVPEDQKPCFIFHDHLVSVNQEAGLDSKSRAEGPWKFDLAMDSSDQFRSDFVDNKRCYELMGRPMINDIIEGFNTCLFCYGQTGTGKTTTIMGDAINGPGLLRRLLDDIFIEVSKMQKQGSLVTVEVQMVEVYNEELNDLLLDKNQPKQKIVTRILPTGVTVQGATTKEVFTAEDVQKLIDFGNSQKTVAPTAMNPQSSRGHTIFKLFLRKSGGDDGTQMTSEVYFADLAGHENIKTTQVTGDRLKELSFINGSLMWLQSVLHSMAETSIATRKSQKTRVDFSKFRNSKLTLLLANALTGNSHTKVIVTLSPSMVHFETSLSSIKFAMEVKGIRMKVTSTAGLDPQQLIAKLQQENAFLKQQLVQGQQAQIPSAPSDSTIVQMQKEIDDLKAELASITGGNASPETLLLRNQVAELKAKLASAPTVPKAVAAKPTGQAERSTPVSRPQQEILEQLKKALALSQRNMDYLSEMISQEKSQSVPALKVTA